MTNENRCSQKSDLARGIRGLLVVAASRVWDLKLASREFEASIYIISS